MNKKDLLECSFQPRRKQHPRRSCLRPASLQPLIIWMQGSVLLRATLSGGLPLSSGNSKFYFSPLINFWFLYSGHSLNGFFQLGIFTMQFKCHTC